MFDPVLQAAHVIGLVLLGGLGGGCVVLLFKKFGNRIWR